MYPHPIAATAATDPPLKRPRGRARVSNDAGFLPKQPPSLFQQARRRRDLVDAFLAELGGEDVLSPVTLMQIRRAAELITAAEMCRAALLNGQAVNVHELLRMEGCASRAIRGLGLKIEAASGPPRGLERARARWAQQENKQESNKAAKAARQGRKPNASKGKAPRT